jgi:hypothetical protein
MATTYNSGGRWTFSNPVNFSYFNIGNKASGHIWKIGYTDGSYAVSNSASPSATPTSYTWYDKFDAPLGKTVGLGNGTTNFVHPNGVLTEYIIIGRNNYGTRNYNGYMFFSGANSWQRVGQIYDSAEIKNLAGSSGGVDSAATIALIDSAYIAARTTAGTDSATTITLIEDTVDSAYLSARSVVNTADGFAKFTYIADSGQTLFTGSDKDGNTLSYNSNTSQIHVYLNGILLTDSDDYNEDSNSAISLTTIAETSDVVTIVKSISEVREGNATFTTNHRHFTADSGQLIFSGNDDDGESLILTRTNFSVFLNGIMLIDSVDYTADTSANSITLIDSAALNDVLSVTTYAGNVTGLDSATVINLIDSAYVQLRQTSGGGGTVDSAYVASQIPTFGTDFIDSAEAIRLITANAIDSGVALQLLLDSIETINLIDSSYVRLRVTKSDLDMEGNKVLFANVYDSPGSFPSASTYHGMFAHAHNTGAGYFAHAGAWTRLANQEEINTYSDSDVRVLVDSAYVQLRQSAATNIDSIGAIGNVNAIGATQGQILKFDSASQKFILASDATGGGGGGSGTVDSAQTISLIEATVDSDYIGTKVDFTRGEFVNEKSQYTATAAQSVFNHSSIDPTHLDVYLNGVLQVVDDDYTATSSTVTFTSGVDSGYSVTIVEKRGRVLTQRGLVESKYYFTTSTPTTSITGADDNGITLDYSVGNLDVYLNGILLKDSDDYSTNAGTTVTLVSATDSNDLVTLINRKGIVVTPNVKNYEYTANAGQLTFSGADINSQTLAYVPDAVQVYLNGILLRNVDYTAVNGTSITLTDSATLNDELVVSAFSNPGQNMDLYKFTADSGQTIFNGNDLTGASLAYNPGNIQVFMNGLLLNDSDDYTASNGMSVVLTSGADASDEIKVASFVANTTTLRTNAWTAPSGTPVAASAGDKLFIDTSSAKTVTLPSSASMGDEIRIIDVTGNASTNNITVSRNGHKIQGAASDLIINVDRAGIGLVYYNSAQGWILIEN